MASLFKYVKSKNTKADAFNLLASMTMANKPLIDNSINHEPPSKLKILEGGIQSSILDYLILQESMGKLFVQRVNNTPIKDGDRFRSMPKGSKKGFPDIIVLTKGRTIFIEAKSNSGSQSTAQKQVEQQLLQQGCEYYIVRSLDFVKQRIGI